MSSRLSRAHLQHATAYLNQFLQVNRNYRDGSEPIDELIEKIETLLPQITAAYEWCSGTSSYQSDASEIKRQFTERKDLPPDIEKRSSSESRRWADALERATKSLTSDPTVLAFLGQFAMVNDMDASILALREETREELRHLLSVDELKPRLERFLQESRSEKTEEE